MNQFKEEWKDVLGYEGIYEISNIGNIRSYKTKKIRKTQKNKEGYERVELWKDGKRKVLLVHRLVAEAFIPNDNNKDNVNYKDGDKTNNCANNLEWVTYKEHNKRRKKKQGELSTNHSNKAIPVYCPELDMKFVSRIDASKYLGCAYPNVGKVIKLGRKTKDKNSGKMVSLVNYVG